MHFDQLNQTLIYAVRNASVEGNLIASSKDFRLIKMFYGNFFEDITETVTREEPKYQASDLIANLGGLISLFTGFSFLTLIYIQEIYPLC